MLLGHDASNQDVWQEMGMRTTRLHYIVNAPRTLQSNSTRFMSWVHLIPSARGFSEVNSDSLEYISDTNCMTCNRFKVYVKN